MFVNLVSRALIVLAIAAPAMAQTELAGSWAARNHEDGLERLGGPYAVDYAGLALNDEARARALSYSADQLSMIEHQCGQWPPFYLVKGPFGMKIWNDSDPVSGNTIAIKIGAWEDKALQTIWMDGRPHPSKNAPHERGGFTTGEWQGTTLVTFTTHIKAGALRRNGAPNSDQTTIEAHFIRHGDVLTVLEIIDDPIYLTEPELISKSFQPDPNPMSPVGPPCIAGYEGVPEGRVPHYLPGTNPSIDELTRFYGIPREATLGGAETMYPEFRKKTKDKFVRPEKCTQNCGAPAPPPPVAPASAGQVPRYRPATQSKTMIRTDASINLRNPCGPLINGDGRAMGSHPAIIGGVCRVGRRSELLALLCTLTLVVSGGCAARQPARSFSDLQQRLHSGNTVYVIDNAGSETKGKIVDVSASALVLDINGTRRRMEQDSIRQVQRFGDSLWNGLIIGAAVGTAGMLIADPTYERCNNDPQRLCADPQTGQRVLAVGVTSAVGAGIDALIRGRHQVYLAPDQPLQSTRILAISPRLGPSDAGLFVTLDLNKRIVTRR